MSPMPERKFMKETWSLSRNPFPANQIASTRTDVRQVNEDIFPEAFAQVREKLVVEAILDQRPLGFLWSRHPGGKDTGLGKTVTLQRIAWRLNHDFGTSLFPDEYRDDANLATALYGSFDREYVTSVNAVLFDALRWAGDSQTGPNDQPLVDVLLDRLCERHDVSRDDLPALERILRKTRSQLAPGLPALKSDAVSALLQVNGTFADALELVRPASRMRSGLEWFEAYYVFAHAAGVPHVVVFIDQLEDLATSTVAKAKRGREVERIRDITCEHVMLRHGLHMVFTMHARAQQAIRVEWGAARLPRFDHAPSTNTYIVTLPGITEDAQAEQLLRTYLAPARPGRDGITPFGKGAVRALRQASEGRIGEFLRLARVSLDVAAEERQATIDGAFVRAVASDASADESSNGSRLVGARGDGRDARFADDLLQ